MKLYEHKNYDEYVKAQIKKNVAKIKTVYVKRIELEAVSKHIKQHLPNVMFGVCHGSRNGKEIKWFKELLEIHIIGTDISYTATKFENTIQWDFHEVKDEWVNSVDFIYSNSFDHSYDPEMCLDQWMSCIKKDGICYIHQCVEECRKESVDAADCLAANRDEYIELFSKKYKIIDEISILKSRVVFAIKHRK